MNHMIMAFCIAAAFTLLCSSAVQSGNLDQVAGPDNASSAMYRLSDLYNRLVTGAACAKRTGGFAEPAAGPGSATGRSLDEIMALMPAQDNTNGATAADVLAGRIFWGLRTDGTWGLKTGAQETRTIDAGTTAQQAGFYGAFDLTGIDPDLSAVNIKKDVTIFGIAGSSAVVNTEFANATAEDIACGKTAYVYGELVVGVKNCQ